MRNPGGYAVIRNPDGTKVELDTFACRHCNAHTHITPGQRPADLGGFCAICSGLICANCVGNGCDEIQRKLERAEAAYHARRSYGI